MGYESDSIFWVDADKIVPNPYQPRREFNESRLEELAESIRMYGIMQPLTVVRNEISHEDGSFATEYQLIAGERRLRASKLLGHTQIPVIIRSGEETELMKLELAIIENLQREDLNPVDRALAFKQLAGHFKLSHAQVAKKVGRSREYVSNSIRLLNLPDTILSALSQGDISDGHARTLLMLNDRPEEQDVVFREILLKKLSVREVERISRKIAQDKVRKKEWLDTDPELIEIEKQFTESLGTRVQISKTEFGGRVLIDYFSAEDLQKLLDMANADRAEAPPESTHDLLNSVAAATPLEEIASPPDVEETTVPNEQARVMNETDEEQLFEPVEDIEEVLVSDDDFSEGDTPIQRNEPTNTEEHTTELNHVESTKADPEPSVIEKEISDISENISEASDSETVSPTVSEATESSKKSSDDEDLYSIKNFTL